MMEDGSFERAKASLEEMLSVRDINSFKHLKGRDVVMDDKPSLQEDISLIKEDQSIAKPKHHPTLFRPFARVSALSHYNPPSSSRTKYGISSTILMEEPLAQSSRQDWGVKKILKDLCSEPVILLCCGFCCYSTPLERHFFRMLSNATG
ncbi:hypothetical protein DITRI_Ditri02bG0132700 [Diplodiscus trichospermus]